MSDTNTHKFTFTFLLLGVKKAHDFRRNVIIFYHALDSKQYLKATGFSYCADKIYLANKLSLSSFHRLLDVTLRVPQTLRAFRTYPN